MDRNEIDAAVEQAVLTAWRAYASGKFEAQEIRMNDIENKLDQNSAATARVEASTLGIVDMMENWDGAMKVIEIIGKVLKPITIIVGFCTAVVAFYYGVKHGSGN
jgi:hypothetical protein